MSQGHDRLLVRGGLLLHLDPPRVERADILIENGRIVAVGTDPGDADQVLDATGHWVMPGLVCAHHHLYSALSCGMPGPTEAPTSFADMLAKVWWRLDEALDEESVRVSGLVGGIQALRAGATTVIDHHASPSYIVGSLECLDQSLDEVGVRRVLCYEVTDRGGPERTAAGLRAHEALLAAPTSGMRAVMVGAHANFTVSDDTLARCGAMAREAGVGVHIHVAEAVDDRQAVGEPLIPRMDRLGALLPGSILAHCVHLGADDLARIGDAGAWVTHQARSNMNNAVGHAPVGLFPETSALGTDGIGADMFAELQAGWFRGSEGGVPWSPARWLRALTDGARLAGDKLGVTLGKLEAGAAGDLLVLDPIPGPPLTADNLAGAFIYRLTSSAVRHVVVDGRLVLADRQPLGVDAGAIDDLARRVAPALWARMA